MKHYIWQYTSRLLSINEQKSFEVIFNLIAIIDLQNI